MSGSLPSPEQFRRLDGLLGQALDLDTDKRLAFLAENAADALELECLTRLLEAAQNAPDLADVAMAAAPGLDSEPLQRVAGWQVLGNLGSGGMAEVVLAERLLAGTRQRAALKLLRAHWRDRSSLQRFARERQILAQLDDARIARLLDGGVLDDGRPWLALEHVQGQHIDRWCDARQANLATRVRLLVEVAGAVASAHRHLVVHGDIKPANVLVTDAGQVKLLDFGIAKVIDEPTYGDGTDTRTTVLTPEFASPEQLAGQPVTTASDVYQLGLLLYLLMCGRRPFDDGPGQHLPTLIRNVSERDAPPPVQALARDPSQLQAVAAARALTPARLRRTLKGDIGAILAKALERCPERRYPSAPELAADLERWLQRFPVQARAPSTGYRLRRLVRRNPIASALMLALTITVIVFTISTHRQLHAITDELAFSQGIREFLGDLFLSAESRPDEPVLVDAMTTLENGVAQARAQFGNQPRLLAELQLVLGTSLISRGHYLRAADLLAQTVRLFERGAGNQRSSLARAWHQLGLARHYSGRYHEAESSFRQAVSLQPGNHAASLNSRASLAWVLHSRGEYDGAEREAAAVWDALNAGQLPDPAFRVEVARIRGDIARDRGLFEQAEQWFHRAEQDLLTHDPDNALSLAWTRSALAHALALSGESRHALPMAREAHATYLQRRGPAHGGSSVTRYRLAISRALAGDADAARIDFEAAKDALTTAGDANQLYAAHARVELAWLDLADKRWQSAAQHFDKAAATLAVINGEGHPRLAEIALGRALLLWQLGDYPAADQSLTLARQVRRQHFGSDHAYSRIANALSVAPYPALAEQARPTEALYEMRRLRRALHAMSADPGGLAAGDHFHPEPR